MWGEKDDVFYRYESPLRGQRGNPPSRTVSSAQNPEQPRSSVEMSLLGQGPNYPAGNRTQQTSPMTGSHQQVAQGGATNVEVTIPARPGTRNRPQTPSTRSSQPQSAGVTGKGPQILPIVSTRPESGSRLRACTEEEPQVSAAATTPPQTGRPAGFTRSSATHNTPASSAGSDRLQTVRRPTSEEKLAPKGKKGQSTDKQPAGEENWGYSADSTSAKSMTPKAKMQPQSTGASSSQAEQAGSARPQPIPAAPSSTPGGSRQDESFVSTSQQFRPRADRGEGVVPGVIRSGKNRAPASKIGIGIETEFMLRALQREYKAQTRWDFAGIVTTNHNASVAVQHPQMTGDAMFNRPHSFLDKWCLTKEPSLVTASEPWGIEMRSPLFVAFPGSQWRRHVEATWKYLKHGYAVTAGCDCATHIHLSVEGGYSLNELKRIAQSVIHFEPAFEALVSPERRAGSLQHARSSWLDSHHLALFSRSRQHSIMFIDSLTDFYTLATVMNPDGERSYGWNFRSIEKYYTVEFRKPQASTTADEVLGWAELAMSFIQASLRYGSIEKLSRVPSTVGGLRWFLRQANVPGLNEQNRLDRLWRGTNPNAFAEPGSSRQDLTSEEQATIEKMKEHDEHQILISASTNREPYW